MRCNNIDFITRNGHSDIFRRDVERVLDGIDFGINCTPELVSYRVISFPRFDDDNSWYRIPCEDRIVYAKKCYTSRGNRYEIAYKSKLSVYGHLERNGYYRVLRLEYNEGYHANIDYSELYLQLTNRINAYRDEMRTLIYGC